MGYIERQTRVTKRSAFVRQAGGGDTTAQPCKQCRPERMVGNRHPLKAAKWGQTAGGEAELESSSFLVLLKRGTTKKGTIYEFKHVTRRFCSKASQRCIVFGARGFHTNSWIRSRMVCRQMGQVLSAALHSMQEACPHWKTSLMWLSMQMGQVIRSSICRYRDCSCSSRLCCSEFSVLGLQSTSVWSVWGGVWVTSRVMRNFLIHQIVLHQKSFTKKKEFLKQRTSLLHLWPSCD